MKIFKNTKGAISIFLVIILVPMLTVSAIFVDASKISLAKSVSETAGDLTLNSALTAYDTKLKDLYGIFATAQSTDEVYAGLENFYRDCISSSGVSVAEANSYTDAIMTQLGIVTESNSVDDIMGLELLEFDVNKHENTSLNNPTIIKNQIVEFMKYRSPINTGLSFITSLESFTTLSEQTELIEQRQNYYQEEEKVMTNAQLAYEAIRNYQNTNADVNDFYTTYEQFHKDLGNEYNGIAAEYIKHLYNNEDNQKYRLFQNTVNKGDNFSVNQYSLINGIDSNGQTKSVQITTEELTADYESSKSDITSDVNKAIDKIDEKNYIVKLNEYKDYYKENYWNFGSYDPVRFVSEVTNYDKNANGVNNLISFESELVDFISEINNINKYLLMCKVAEGEEIDETTQQKIVDLNEDAESYVETYNKLQTELKNAYADIITVGNVLNEDKEEKNEVVDIYNKINTFINEIDKARTELNNAVFYLGEVEKSIKDGGLLDNAKDNWNGSANNEKLDNSALATQDKAEIEDLDVDINIGEVQELSKRLKNISDDLEKLSQQIKDDTFYGKNVHEIKELSNLSDALNPNINDYVNGTDKKLLPMDTNKLAEACNSIISKAPYKDGGTAIDIKWINDSANQPNLDTSKPDFFTYLETKFKDTSQKNDEIKNTYDNIDSQSKNQVNLIENTSTPKDIDENPVKSSNEIKDQPSLPSNNKVSLTPSVSSDNSTDLNNTTTGLSSMFENLVSAVESLAVSFRDNLYVSDYILSMFSYDTVDKNTDGKTIANPQSITLNSYIDNNLSFGNEVEYILYGGHNAGNKLASYGTIFGIRFAFNLIYAFATSEIRDTALAIATPISAATLGVVPPQLIQVAIIIGAALCESGLDVSELSYGKEVPLYKNSSTWRMSISGLINEVVAQTGEIVKDIAGNVIDEGHKKLQELLNYTDEELTAKIDEVEGYVTDTVEDTYYQLITENANIAIQKLTSLAQEVLDDATLGMDQKVAQVENNLKDWANTLGDDITSEAQKQAISIIVDNGYITQIIESLNLSGDNISQQGTDYINSAAEEINEIIDNLRKTITDQIINGSDMIKNAKDEAMAEIKSAAENGADELKDAINTQLDGVFGSGGSSSLSGNGNTGISGLLSFSYDDYLRLFLMVSLYTDEEGVLLRTADVMQVNMAKVTGNSEYLLSNSAVYLNIYAKIQVKPTFLAMPIFADVENNPATNGTSFIVEYNNIKGY